MDISFDPNMFVALGIDPNANSMDNPKPPVDGIYSLRLKLAPIPATKKVDGKEVTNSKIVAGVNYVGKAIAPQGDAATLKADDQGRANYTLYLDAEVLNDDGKKVRTLQTYVTSNTNRNGASMLFDLARTIVEVHGPVIDLAAAIQAHNNPSATPNPVWLGIAEAIAELLEGNPDGLEVPGFVSTNLEKSTGKKKPGTTYDETEVIAYGSANIQKKFAEHWTGDKLPEGFNLRTFVKGFKA